MYPTKPTRQPGNARALSERVERLTGDRGKDDAGAAVTREVAASLGNITIRSKLVTAAPTAADHNALVADIHAIAAILNAMGAKLTGL